LHAAAGDIEVDNIRPAVVVLVGIGTVDRGTQAEMLIVASVEVQKRARHRVCREQGTTLKLFDVKSGRTNAFFPS
jgi:hypothetical protein